jgi:hypothetical protein
VSRAARQAKLRDRQRRGVVVVQVEADCAVAETLIDLGWLDESESEHRHEIGNAISRLLADLTCAHRRKKP